MDDTNTVKIVCDSKNAALHFGYYHPPACFLFSHSRRSHMYVRSLQTGILEEAQVKLHAPPASLWYFTLQDPARFYKELRCTDSSW